MLEPPMTQMTTEQIAGEKTTGRPQRNRVRITPAKREAALFDHNTPRRYTSALSKKQ
jgi:hypothetical protein